MQIGEREIVIPQRKPNPELVDVENPEATEEWFVKARPASEALPELFGAAIAEEMLKPKRGRPRLPHPKEQVNIRLDADVLSAFRQMGSGVADPDERRFTRLAAQQGLATNH